MQLDELKALVINALDELKAVELTALDVRERASFTDCMIIASGLSSRQVRAMADKVVETCRQVGIRPFGMEGEQEGDWILVDLGDIVVHLMRPEIRDFYNLEKLWSVGPHNNNSISSSSTVSPSHPVVLR